MLFNFGIIAHTHSNWRISGLFCEGWKTCFPCQMRNWEFLGIVCHFVYFILRCKFICSEKWKTFGILLRWVPLPRAGKTALQIGITKNTKNWKLLLFPEIQPPLTPSKTPENGKLHVRKIYTINFHTLPEKITKLLIHRGAFCQSWCWAFFQSGEGG